MFRPILNSAVRWCCALVVVGLMVSGCSTQQTVKTQKAFFKPFAYRAKVQPPPATAALKSEVSRMERRLDSVSTMNNALSKELMQLRQALDAKERLIVSLHDSILAERRSAAAAPLLAQATPIVKLQEPLKQQVPEKVAPIAQTLPPTKPSTGSTPSALQQTQPKISVVSANPARSNDDVRAYESAVGQMRARHFTDATDSFQSLLENGVREDLADNCEYWLGEIRFEKKDFAGAVAAFERVIAMPGSNKAEDAMMMLGQSYESLELLAKAKATYERLIRVYPSGRQARSAKERLQDEKFSPAVRPRPTVPRTST